MKKILALSFLLIMALVIAGCGCGKKDQASSKKGKSQSVKTIQEAMGMGKKMQCTFSQKDPESGADNQYVMYTDGSKNSKTQFTVKAKNKDITINSLFLSANGGEMYTWNENEKSGMKFSTECMKDFADNLPTEQKNNRPVDNPEENYKNAANINCFQVESVDLAVPADVSFKDQCEMLKDLSKKIPSIPNIPK